jgi:RNA polymerase sigma-70 factor (ECF subfamily)
MDESGGVVRTVPLEPSDVPELASSFQLFVEAESAGFHGALRLLTRDRSEAEDLMQDAFLKVWERWEHVQALDDPTGYLYRTAMNLHRKHLRRAAVALRHAIRPHPPHDHLDDVETRDVVLRTLAALTRRQRMSLVLTDLLGYTSEDAADVMGVKATTVRVLASQGRAALRDSMEADVDA